LSISTNSGKIAIISDIHSNFEALERCLSFAQEQDIQKYAFLGDLVGYNADPVAVVASVRSIVEQGHGFALLGNHDEAIFKQEGLNFNQDAMTAIEWTRQQLSAEDFNFLKNLPRTKVEDQVFFAHSTPFEPEQWHYVQHPQQARRCAEFSKKPYTILGHVHDSAVFYELPSQQFHLLKPHPDLPVKILNRRKWVITVGSAGQPRDGQPKAHMSILDFSRQCITFHRLAYDHISAAQKIENAGLPKSLARRLIFGF
jgi:predicted phosphodiesterase